MSLRHLLEAGTREEQLYTLASLSCRLYNQVVDINLDCRYCKYALWCVRGKCMLKIDSHRQLVASRNE